MAFYIGNRKCSQLIVKQSENVVINRKIDNGVYKMPVAPFTFSLPSNATDINSNALRHAFYGCTSLTSVDLSSLANVSGSNALEDAFYGCTSLTSVDLSSLDNVSGTNAFDSAFYGCISLTYVDLDSLTSLTGASAFKSAFAFCTELKTLSFPSLASLQDDTHSPTNQFNNMLEGVTGCTVHFPSNLQQVIGSWSDTVSGFGGTNTIVLFDLPATQ